MPKLGYRKKLHEIRDHQYIDHIQKYILRKTKGKGASIKKGYNKYIGAAAGAGLGFIVGNVPGSIIGGSFGYHAGKRLD